MTRSLFTSESVTEGHPDKMADQISDTILDALLEQDPFSRVACEVLLAQDLVVVAGEVSTKADVDYVRLVREKIEQIGYDSTKKGFTAQSCRVLLALNRQSPDIALGVSSSKTKAQGAGDQGLMFGYAIRESEELMPLSIHWAHQLARRLSQVRKSGLLPWLRPDGKTQVTLEYESGVPRRVDSIVVSAQHDESVSLAQIEEAIRSEVIGKIIPVHYLDGNTKIHVNPTGRFVIGGPEGDCGLTGRKIIVDTYGGHGAHGGGAFSGKDPSKVDRSASYKARYLAKNIVASEVADSCLVQIAYAIGVAEPVSLMLNTFGTEKVGLASLRQVMKSAFQLSPAGIIESLDLLKPVYSQTAAYGHFGRCDFRWEKTDRADVFRALK